jgi:hypothetical protein
MYLQNSAANSSENKNTLIVHTWSSNDKTDMINNDSVIRNLLIEGDIW